MGRIKITIAWREPSREKRPSALLDGPVMDWGICQTPSHLPCNRQIASIASLERKFSSLIVQVTMDLMDFIATFVGKEVIGELSSWVPFLPFIKYLHFPFLTDTCPNCSIFIYEAAEIGSQQPGVNNHDL